MALEQAMVSASTPAFEYILRARRSNGGEANRSLVRHRSQNRQTRLLYCCQSVCWLLEDTSRMKKLKLRIFCLQYAVLIGSRIAE